MGGTGIAFWRCPKCGKRVPSRLVACQCGFERTASTEPIVDVILSTPAPDPSQSAIAQNLRQRREPPPRTEVVYVPVPAQPGETLRVEASLPPVDTVPNSAPATPLPFAIVREDSRAPESLAVAPMEQESLETEVDVRRRIGAQTFERQVAALANKADQADVAWQRYREGCRMNLTSVTAVAGAADRDWLVVAGVNVTTQTWTEACAEAGTFFALVRQVRDGMCTAEDGARQSWVLPGTRRDLRHRYRLDWDGWDSACS
jgi:hypothetical protein